jgi:hypothetical protein
MREVAACLDRECKRNCMPRDIVNRIQIAREAIIIARKTIIDINLADYLSIARHGASPAARQTNRASQFISFFIN